MVGVITAVDAPSGRGLQKRESAVKQYALSKGLCILQPEKLKNPDFLAELASLKADLQVVVAFRMLPELVWAMPPKGTFNLHASLLPNYRGAAPINRAIMDGAKETGATTFFLQQEIDTGSIIFQEKLPIGDDETAGELHDRLMMTGAQLVLKTVRAIESGNYSSAEQNMLGDYPRAPKIFKEDGVIDWHLSLDDIYNQVRGLSPYPAAFTMLDGKVFKIYKAAKEPGAISEVPGTFVSDNKNFLKVAADGGYLQLLEVQLEGKKRIAIKEFLNGYRF